MRVYVNGEARELAVYDRLTGKEYAKLIVCAQERLETDEYGAFCMTEEEFSYWRDIVTQQQESEDIIFLLATVVDKQEMDDYIFEETKYLTATKASVQMENLCVKDLKTAVETKDFSWLEENGFRKTAEKLQA
ncbi:hypothetical protein HMPREF3033_00530 [Veillonellaceae bacterium DNF00751]|jgi:hypothetical protein|uniref:Phage protein n=1 Tax=Megasphaera lornae TaxID=1000568 RepID=A0ABN0CZK3_9FIRM|nr:hypothetical protein [Megasphaera lornae]EGL35106.1 hypothetical protein HMPREF1039_0603 [Megasphaera lornae]KXB92944.1 hypothetical protein HMPREF3033_00530 [Veillonellaceae bacterium DNF00751]